MRVSGLASGMDTDSIVKEMMKIQKMPLDKLMQQKTFTEWQQKAFRDTNLAFSNLRTSASNLRLQSSFNSYVASSPNPGSFTVGTTANAMSGSYKVQVVSVASAAKLNSSAAITMPEATDTDGNVVPARAAKSTDMIGIAGNIKVTGLNTDINIEATDTFADVAKKIQDASAASVPALRASFDNTTSRFFIASKGMGADQAFTMDFTNVDGTLNPALADKIINNAGATTATAAGAADGSIKFDGIEINGLKTNQTTVNGVIVNLVQAGAEETIIISSSPEKPMEMIKDFVKKYNETIETLQKQLVEKRYPDFQPLSADQKKGMTEKEIELWEEKAMSGLLRSDPVLKRALTDLRTAFMGPVNSIANGNLNMLSQIGINTGNYSEGGKLFIDEKKLNEALSNKPDEVMALFTSNNAEGKGIGVRVYDTLNTVIKNLSTKAGSPSSTIDNSVLSRKIKQMDQDISKWERNLTRIEERYWKQFTAMEKALSQMNSQSAWMQQNMFGGM